MLLRVAEIKTAGTLDLQEDIDPKALLKDGIPLVSFKTPVHADIHAQMAENDVYVRGRIKTKIHFKCARCLKDFEKNFEGEFQQAYPDEDEEIVVDDEIREILLIDLPIKPLCKESCQVDGVKSEKKDTKKPFQDILKNYRPKQ